MACVPFFLLSLLLCHLWQILCIKMQKQVDPVQLALEASLSGVTCFLKFIYEYIQQDMGKGHLGQLMRN